MKLITLAEATIGTSALILILFLVRKGFRKKLNPNIKYFLWIFVMLRIFLPISLDFTLPITNAAMTWQTENLDMDVTAWKKGGVELDQADEKEVAIISFDNTVNSAVVDREIKAGVNKGRVNFEMVFITLWLIGMAGLTGYVVYNNLRLYRKIRKNRKEKEYLPEKIRLYEAEGYNCLLGFLHPAIYLDPQVYKDDKLRTSVLLHELQHYRVKDNLWVFLRVLCLILQWYNPLVWAAYYAAERDCELACDYRVIREMNREERAAYGRSLLSVIEVNSADKKRICFATSMGREKRFLKKRMEGIMQPNYKKIVMIPCTLILIATAVVFVNIKVQSNTASVESPVDSEMIKSLTPSEEEEIELSLDIREYYITNTGDPANLYYIDEQGVLWGSGRNQYGQLGQGTRDDDYHEELVKIAENVVHVDYSQQDFVIYLTADQKLYGLGNAGTGALQQFINFSEEEYFYSKNNAVTEPVLLMEDVIYAICGRSDVAAIKNDSSVWIWGTIWLQNFEEYYYEREPIKVLEEVVLVTGGFFHHAALGKDGTLWTWGHNYTGNCGIEGELMISKPMKAAEGVTMVWTENFNNNIGCQDIREFGGEYDKQIENTIIQKNDGEYYICGANVGETEVILPIYYEAAEYSIICTHEFLPYNMQ